MNSLYILDINPSLDISFANIFPDSVDSLFVLLIVFLNFKKFFVNIFIEV